MPLINFLPLHDHYRPAHIWRSIWNNLRNKDPKSVWTRMTSLCGNDTIAIDIIAGCEKDTPSRAHLSNNSQEFEHKSKKCFSRWGYFLNSLDSEFGCRVLECIVCSVLRIIHQTQARLGTGVCSSYAPWSIISGPIAFNCACTDIIVYSRSTSALGSWSQWRG